MLSAVSTPSLTSLGTARSQVPLFPLSFTVLPSLLHSSCKSCHHQDSNRGEALTTRNTRSVTESQPDLLNNDSGNYFVGVCTGLFAATAAATCESQQEIIDITPEIIAIAFYTGVEAARRSSLIEPETNTWARVVRCTEANYTREQLTKFHLTKVLLFFLLLLLPYPLEAMMPDSLKRVYHLTNGHTSVQNHNTTTPSAGRHLP